MSKAFKLLCVLIFPIAGFAQNIDSAKWNLFPNLFDNPYRNFSAGKIVGARIAGMLSTNRVSNDFIYPFIVKKKLEKNVIDNNLDRAGNKILNFESNMEMSFIDLDRDLFNNKKLNWYLKFGSHQRSYVNVSNDAMKLIFRGNTESDKYSFDNCTYYNGRFNKIGGGIYYHEDKKPRSFNLSFGMHILQMLNYGSIETDDNNYLQGNEDSFQLGINYKAAFASAGSFSKDGLGIGAELVFNHKLNARTTWGMRFENFGIAAFNQKASTYSGSGNYRFNGVFIPSIKRLGEEGYFKNQLDSFTDPLINKKENQDKNVIIAPTTFIHFTTRIRSVYIQIGIRHNGTKSAPAAELRVFSFVRSNVLFGLALGKFDKTYLNADINWSIKKRWFLQIGLGHIEALVLSKKFGGLGGNAGLQFVF